MGKVALITFDFQRLNKVWTQVLTNFGIEFVACRAASTAQSAQIETPAGRFPSSSNDLRGFFRQFDAVIICDTISNLSQVFFHNYAFHWLAWNAPEDPPFVFFNPHFSVTVTDISLPSDFPIIRPDANDLVNTLAAADAGTANTYNPLTSQRTRGARVRFEAEGITLYLPTICNAHSNNIPYLWRLDTAKHAPLANTAFAHRVSRNGKAGEVLAVPEDDPDWSYPANTIVAYRYKNCFWLPHAVQRRVGAVNLWDTGGTTEQNIFWLLYGLQLAGVEPKYRIPIFLETDHPLQGFASAPPFTVGYKEQFEVLLATYEYWQDFARRTGTVFHGVTVGARHRGGGFHWYFMHDTSLPADARAVAQQLNVQLVQYHRQGTQCSGVHDHTIALPNGGSNYWGAQQHTGFVRHSGMQYGAPNDVPIRRGNFCVNPAVLLQGAAGADATLVTVGDETMMEWDLLRSGAGTTFDLNLESVHAARIIIESEIEEMLALGFSDGYCGGHKYTNTANNDSGGECYWQALKEMGFRGVRSSPACNKNRDTKRVAPNRMWHEFQLVGHNEIDISATSAGYSRGLYHPASPAGGDAVRDHELDFGGDISTDWSSDQTLAWRAYRRVLSHTTGIWLSASVMNLGATYLHPAYAACVMNLTNPTARFDG